MTKPQILLCRFLLNLRQINSASGGSESACLTNPSSLQFQFETRIVANMGEPLGDEAEETCDAYFAGSEEQE